MKKPLENLGMIGLGKGSPKELDTYVKSEHDRWAKVIKSAGLAGTQ
jgi:tripartite-type tricarboxylate transporter receptor subunit TctC